jgi:hypothetical protein
MRFIDTPFKYRRAALIFIVSGLPRGVVRVD